MESLNSSPIFLLNEALYLNSSLKSTPDVYNFIFEHVEDKFKIKTHKGKYFALNEKHEIILDKNSKNALLFKLKKLFLKVGNYYLNKDDDSSKFYLSQFKNTPLLLNSSNKLLTANSNLEIGKKYNLTRYYSSEDEKYKIKRLKSYKLVEIKKFNTPHEEDENPIDLYIFERKGKKIIVFKNYGIYYFKYVEFMSEKNLYSLIKTEVYDSSMSDFDPQGLYIEFL